MLHTRYLAGIILLALTLGLAIVVGSPAEVIAVGIAAVISLGVGALTIGASV